MIRRCTVLVVYLLFMFFSVPGLADSEYWVSVGSYRSYSEAEAAREKAGMRLPESFSISEANLDSGLWYRVMAGPYLTKEIADHMVDEARRQGFTSPWVLMREAELVGSIDEQLGGLLSSEPTSADEIDLQNFHLDVPDEAPMDIPGFNAPTRPDTEQEHKLVDEAPSGYQLNQLHRN